MEIQYQKDNNSLLKLIKEEDWINISHLFELFNYSKDKVLVESGKRFSYLYFPTTAIISISHDLENGLASEVAIIGNDGLLGVSALLGDGISFETARVTHQGECFRINIEFIRKEFGKNKELRSLLLRYSQSLIAQISQNIVCNRHHLIEQQVARHLLQKLDRLKTNTIHLTHEDICQSLGVRRESITEASKNLKKSCSIEYKRGKIEIINRAVLEEKACDCYKVIRKEQNRLLPIHIFNFNLLSFLTIHEFA